MRASRGKGARPSTLLPHLHQALCLAHLRDSVARGGRALSSHRKRVLRAVPCSLHSKSSLCPQGTRAAPEHAPDNSSNFYKFLRSRSLLELYFTYQGLGFNDKLLPKMKKIRRQQTSKCLEMNFTLPALSAIFVFETFYSSIVIARC